MHPNFPFAKELLLLFLNILPRQYQLWLGIHENACDKSLANTCFKKRPNQVALFEIEILKSYMTKKAHEFWSIGSIWAKAVTDGAISMSSASWYRYSRKLGLSEARKPKKNNINEALLMLTDPIKRGTWTFPNIKP